MEFKLPELGEGVHEGELIKWRVQLGASVTYDQPLCEIMTDKATIEIPSAFQGQVESLHAREGEVVHVGQVLLRFAQPPQAQTPNAEVAPSQRAPVATLSPADESPVSSQARHEPDADPSKVRIAAAPSVRRQAREMGVALDQLVGSGPGGRILRADLPTGQPTQISTAATVSGEASSSPSALNSPHLRMPAQAHGDQTIPFRGLRKKIAERMRHSLDTAAHFTYVEEADATELVALRNRAKTLATQRGVKLTYLPFVMKAMVEAIRQYPTLNSRLDETRGELILKHEVNIGLSIQTDEGLTAPVIRNVGAKSILQLAAEIDALVQKARAQKLSLEDFQGGTITLTNAGSIGGLFTTPVINYPEVAIVGLNKITRRPVVRMVDGCEQIVIRDWTYFSISLDHRVIDGAVGAQFMKTLIGLIEDPSLLGLG